MNIIEQLSLNIVAIAIAMIVIILLLMYLKKKKKISDVEMISNQKINIESYKEASPSFHETTNDTKQRKKKMNRKITSVFTVIVILLLVVSVIGVFVFQENKVTAVQNDYENLQNRYNSLQSNYGILTNNYNELQDSYNDLSVDYKALNQIIKQYNQLPIDHLMGLTYNTIREECQPNYHPWFGTYYYDKTSVDYAAVVCAHDLGRRYWPSVENKYYQITGTYLHNDACNKITKLADIIGVSRYDSNVVKIEKILEFITGFITYQSDLNEEFLFPTETITFRSGDCDDFSILVACLFEYVGIKSAIGFFENTTLDMKHSMVLVKLPDLGNYGYFYYSDLTKFGLSNGKWIIIEPQIVISGQYNRNVLQKYSLIVASEIPN